VNLNVAPVQTHGVAEDGLIGALDHSIQKNEQDQTEDNRYGSDSRPAPVAPHVAPCHFNKFTHSPISCTASFDPSRHPARPAPPFLFFCDVHDDYIMVPRETLLWMQGRGVKLTFPEASATS
jgi:hypothetical protein